MKKMTYVVIESDKRMACVARQLCEAGCAVAACDEFLPLAADVTYIYAPYVSLSEEQAAALRDNSTVFVGRLKNEALIEVERKNVTVVEMCENKAYLVKNAVNTAEAALMEMLKNTERMLCDLKVLVVGFGRLGRAVVECLRRFGSTPDVLTTRPHEVLLYATPVEYGEVELSHYDVIVSTVPSNVFDKVKLLQVRHDAYILELASPPYCCDTQLAESVGVNMIIASALPSKSRAVSAAELIVDMVLGRRV